MGETMTSEQRAAIAVHNATQNRMCLNLSGNGQICIACSEVADQIDAAVEVERQRSQAALAAANARAEKAEQLVCDFQAAAMIDVGNMGGPCAVEPRHVEKHVNELRTALAAARRECDAARAKYMREGFALAQAHAEVSEHDGWNRTAPFIEWREANAQLEAALAAPAASAPDTSPATLEAWEKRLQREAEVNDPVASPGAGEEGKHG